MTKQFEADTDSPDRPALTPAMIQAGVDELCDYDPATEFASDAVVRIFYRMVEDSSTACFSTDPNSLPTL